MQIKGESQKLKVKSRRNFNTSALLFLFSFFYSITANAQCAMCRAALESEGNTAKAKGINDGIVYLMVIPYVLVGLVFLRSIKCTKRK